MKAREICDESVRVMKEVLGRELMTEAINRVRERSVDDNQKILDQRREEINELVKAVAEAGDAGLAAGASPELVDALVVRYLRNRDLFMKAFPDGIDDIEPDPYAIWAAMMISPGDETSA